MLSRTVTCLLLLLTLNQLSAQFSIGVQGGVNTSTIHFTKESRDPKARNHYFAGITTTYEICDKWSVGLDAQYAVRGVGYNVNGDQNSLGASRRKNLDFTPKITCQLFKNLDISMGVYQSFLQRHEIQLGDSNDWLEPFATYYSKTDVGLSPELRFHVGRFSLLASGQLGLKKIAAIEFANENGETIGDVYEKNRALQIGLGYRIWGE